MPENTVQFHEENAAALEKATFAKVQAGQVAWVPSGHIVSLTAPQDRATVSTFPILRAGSAAAELKAATWQFIVADVRQHIIDFLMIWNGIYFLGKSWLSEPKGLQP